MPEATDGLTPNSEPIDSQTIGSKRYSDGAAKGTRRPRRKGPIDNLNNLLVEANKNSFVLKETVERNDPNSMAECLQKLCSVENLTTHALLLLQDVLKENKDNKTILMTWEGEVLHKWIEYMIENHLRYNGSRIWL
ncbi:hypothetical protein MA16_Dca020121 [Dendrobium catenatum]|uniref:Uncharacterized protein n=1 Tax=Dendrobium catenatum TaxID=906689 RepID=A0A2I0WES5_9ASPA|nr:hypothetical protein MA16_Dca020121 [Dendrobium catenatum]